MSTIVKCQPVAYFRCVVLAYALIFGGSVVHAQKPTQPDSPNKLELQPIDADQKNLAKLKDSAVQWLATTKGLDAAGLTVIKSAVARYPLKGVTAYAFKVLDGGDSSVHDLLLDEFGMELEQTDLKAAEGVARLAALDKIHPFLAEGLAARGEGELVPVIGRVNEPVGQTIERPDPPAELSKEAKEAMIQGLNAAQLEVVAATVRPIVTPLSAADYETAPDSATLSRTSTGEGQPAGSTWLAPPTWRL